MQTQPITLDRDEARALYRKYKEHLHYSQPIDHEIMRAYQLIAQGRLIIKALESITKAGLGSDGLPKLAIVQADAAHCYLNNIAADGSCQMTMVSGWSRRNNERAGKRFRFPASSFPFAGNHRFKYEAIVPIVPLSVRPARGLANYHILWEAHWSRMVPVDPFLLRRIGLGDMWLVVAMWELTPVEQAALAARI